MKEQLPHMRMEYSRDVLHRTDLHPNPLVQFEAWFEQSAREGGDDPHAFVLSTVSADGIPNGRVVLLKGLEEDAFVFYTNYQSAKGRDLEANPRAAATFFWPHLQRQVRIIGHVERISPERSTAYFQSRPRGSQIGAWASPQSEELPNRDALEQAWREAELRFGDGPIERPAHWGGFALSPERMEFWQGRPSRLHDRFCYTKKEASWELTRLAP